MPGQLMAAPWGTRLRRGITALVVLIGLLIGVPALLLSAGGDPMPHHATSLSSIGHNLTSTDTNGHLFISVVLVVAWLGWAAFALSVLLELVGRLRQRPTLRIPGFALPRRAAAGLFTSIAIMVGTAGMSATAFAAGPPAAPPAAVAVVGAPSVVIGTPVSLDGVVIGAPVSLDGPSGASSTLVYQVRRGDTLGGISERFLGHFDSYPRLIATNPDLITNGADNIQPGWTLHLPSDARDRGVLTHASGTLSSTLATPGAVTTNTQVTAIITTIGGTAPRGAAVGVASVASPSAAPTDSGPLVTMGDVRPLTPAQAAQPIPDTAASPALVLTALGLTSGILGAHLLLWNRRRRQDPRDSYRRGGTMATLEPEVDDTAESVELNRLDLALRDLASLLGEHSQTSMPDIMGSWMADGNVHLMLTEPCADAPAPWISRGLMWTLPAHVPTHSYFAGTTAPLPALVTVGGGEDRRVLLDLERLGVVTIGGDPNGARDLLRHVGAELTNGIWSDDVTIGIAGFDEADTRRLTSLGRGRVRASVSIADALDDAGRWINEAHERLAGLGVNNVLTGRVSATPAEARRLSPYALLIAGPDADDLERLERVDAYLEGRGRGQLAIAASERAGTRLAAGRANMGRWPLTVGVDHTVTMEFLDTRIPAVSLDQTELGALADSSAGPRALPSKPADIPIGRHRMIRRQPAGHP